MTDIVLRSTDVPADFHAQMHMARVLAESDLRTPDMGGKATTTEMGRAIAEAV